jgi:hypothetical protein
LRRLVQVFFARFVTRRLRVAISAAHRRHGLKAACVPPSPATFSGANFISVRRRAGTLADHLPILVPNHDVRIPNLFGTKVSVSLSGIDIAARSVLSSNRAAPDAVYWHGCPPSRIADDTHEQTKSAWLRVKARTEPIRLDGISQQSQCTTSSADTTPPKASKFPTNSGRTSNEASPRIDNQAKV